MMDSAREDPAAGINEIAALIDGVPLSRHLRRFGSHWGHVSAGFTLQNVTIPFPLVYLSLSRGLELSVAGHPVDFRRGSLVWLSGGVPYSMRCTAANGAVFTGVRFGVFDNASGSNCTPPSRKVFFSHTVSSCAEYERLFEQYARLAVLDRESGFATATSSSFLQAIMVLFLEEARAGAADGGAVARIQRVRAMIDQDSIRRWSVSELAAAAGLSPRHLTRLFIQSTGQSPKSYQIQSRLRQAQYLLCESQLSVKECAFRLGYADAFIFSKQFRSVFGYPPSEAAYHKTRQ